MPYVWQSEDPETITIRTPITVPDEYFETVLTPEEARRLAIDLLNDAERAAHMVAVNKRLRKPG